jgi:hypothetical protein
MDLQSSIQATISKGNIQNSKESGLSQLSNTLLIAAANTSLFCGETVTSTTLEFQSSKAS